MSETETETESSVEYDTRVRHRAFIVNGYGALDLSCKIKEQAYRLLHVLMDELRCSQANVVVSIHPLDKV